MSYFDLFPWLNKLHPVPSDSVKMPLQPSNQEREPSIAHRYWYTWGLKTWHLSKTSMQFCFQWVWYFLVFCLIMNSLGVSTITYGARELRVQAGHFNRFLSLQKQSWKTRQVPLGFSKATAFHPPMPREGTASTTGRHHFFSCQHSASALEPFRALSPLTWYSNNTSYFVHRYIQGL